jgi:hypothetical protein
MKLTYENLVKTLRKAYDLAKWEEYTPQQIFYVDQSKYELFYAIELYQVTDLEIVLNHIPVKNLHAHLYNLHLFLESQQKFDAKNGFSQYSGVMSEILDLFLDCFSLVHQGCKKKQHPIFWYGRIVKSYSDLDDLLRQIQTSELK